MVIKTNRSEPLGPRQAAIRAMLAFGVFQRWVSLEELLGRTRPGLPALETWGRKAGLKMTAWECRMRRLWQG